MNVHDLTVSTAPTEPRFIWRDGALIPWGEATVHVLDAGHAGAAAIFEGIKAYVSDDGDRLLIYRLDEHLRRLEESARLCRIALGHTREQLRDGVIDTLRANEYRADTYIRPFAFPRGPVRDPLVPEWCATETVIDTWPAVSNLESSYGCRAGVSSWRRIADTAMPPRAKALANYHNGRLATIEARTRGFDWPILLNDNGSVSEGPGACVAAVIGGAVVTPPLISGVLPGITRATIIELCAELGIQCEQQQIDRSQLYLADELFFMGTAWENLPITEIDGLVVGAGKSGPVTLRLRQAYADLVRGRSSQHADWLTEVPLD